MTPHAPVPPLLLTRRMRTLVIATLSTVIVEKLGRDLVVREGVMGSEQRRGPLIERVLDRGPKEVAFDQVDEFGW